MGDGFRGLGDGNMMVLYEDEEVYLTEEAIDNAKGGYEKAVIVYNLLRRIESNKYDVYERNKWDDLLDNLLKMFPEMGMM